MSLVNNPAEQTPLRPLYRAPPQITPAAPVGFSPMTQTPNQIIASLKSQGILTMTPGANGQNNLTLNKPLSSLSQDQINQLNHAVGFNITDQQIQQSKDESDLQNEGIITTSGGNLTLNKPISSLSPSDIAKLNNLGFNITQTEITASVNLNDLESRGIVTSNGNNLTLNKPLSSLTPEDIAKLNAIGFNITPTEITQSQQQATQAQPNTTLVQYQTDLEGAGMIGTNSSGNLVLQGNVANATPTQINQLLALGFTQTNITTMQNLISLERAGIAYENSKGEIVLEKDPSTLTAAQKSQLQTLGFTSAQLTTPTGTTKFTPTQIVAQNTEFATALKAGQITQTQYNEAMAQQNANLTADQAAQQQAISTLTSQGIIATTHDPSTPLQKSMVLTKPLATLSDNNIQMLQQAGFSITSEELTQRIEAQNLISSGTLKVSGNTLTLAKPVTALTDADISRLKDIGINVPNLPKNVGEYATEWSETLPKPTIGAHPSFGLSTLPGGSQYLQHLTPKIAAVADDVINNIFLAPVELVDQLTGQNYLGLKEGTRGPTSSNLKYYESITPAEQIAVTGTSVAATVAISYGVGQLGGMAVGFVAEKIPVVAAGLTDSLLASNIPLTEVSISSLASGIKAIASNIGIAGNAVIDALPLGEVSTEQVTAAMSELLQNAKFQQVLVWGSMAGLNSYNVYSQLKSGVPIDTIIENESVSIAAQVGGLLGFQAGLDAFKPISPSSATELQRALSLESVKVDGGTKLILAVDTKDLPDDVAGLVQTGFDPESGKIVLVGIGKSEGLTFPVKIEMTNQMWQDFVDAKEIGADELQAAILKWVKPEDFYNLMQKYPDISSLTNQQLFDLVSNYTGKEFAGLTTDQITELAGKVQRLTTMTERQATDFIIEHPELTNMIQNKIDTIAAGYPKEMTEKQLMDALYKELNNGPLSESVSLVVREVPIKDLSSFSMDLRAAFITTDRDFIADLYNKLISAGVDESKAAYLTSHILTSDVDTVSGILKSLDLSDSQASDIMALRIEAGGPTRIGDSAIFRALKQGGLSDTQAQQVIQAYASTGKTGVSDVLSSGMPKMNTNQLKAVADMFDQETLANMELAPEQLSRIVNVMTDETATSFALMIPPAMFASLSSEALSHTMLAMTPEQINTIMFKLSPEELTKIVPKIDSKTLSSVITGLSSNQLNSVLTALTTEQVNAVIQTLSTEQLTSMLQTLTTEQLQTLVNNGTIPITALPSTFPILPKLPLKLLDDSGNLIQGTTIFEVKLMYGNGSQTYKVRAKSFHGAAQQALLRRQSSQLPTDVKVTIQYELKQEATA